MSKRGLGKGLSALLPNLDEIEESQVIKQISINEIEPNRNQPRKVFDEEKLQELSDSIRIHGIIQPLIVKQKEDYYEIVAGERRWRAARIAGLKQVPVIVKGYDYREIVEVSLIENIQRHDLNSLEQAKAFRYLIEEFSLSQEEVAAKVGKSRSSVANILRLLQLDENVQQLLLEDQLTSGHARALIPIQDHRMQYEVARKIVEENLSVRETEKWVKKLLEEPKTKKEEKTEMDPIYKQIEETFRQILGTKVQISKGRKKGKIEIEYYSDDDLDRILHLIQSIE